MIILLFFIVGNIHAQQGIGINETNADPDNSAILDVSSNLKGVLLPRVALTGTTLSFPVNSPAVSLIVYNISTNNDVTPGYYFWDGAKWVRIASGIGTVGPNYDSTFCHPKLKLDTIQLCGTNTFNVIGNINIPFDSAYKIGNNKILRTQGNNLFAGLNSGNNTGTGRNNLIIGDTSFILNTTGYKNTSVGDSTLTENTSGNKNDAFGYGVLANNTTGYNNNGFGYKALYHNISGYYNNGFGYYVLASNTTGYYNDGMGYMTLFHNTSGSFNSAYGLAALYSNTTGGFNNSFGYENQYYLTTGHNNTSMGMEALHHNSSGSFNTAIGSNSQHSAMGDYNTSVGDSSLASCEPNGSAGSFNSAFGFYALSKITSGNFNTAIGDSAGYNISTGSKNIIIGSGISAVYASGNFQLNIGNAIIGSLDTGNIYIKNRIIAPYIKIPFGAGLNKILVSDANGNGTWQSIPTKHFIGELYQGGLIFYVDQSGQHGLICSLVDLNTSSTWSDISSLIGVTAQSDWNGPANSTAMIGQSGHTSSAADICHTYTNADYGTGIYSDWYLPAIDELSKLYQAKYEVNKVLETDSSPTTLGLSGSTYWSSSEDSFNSAWGWAMNNGYPSIGNKNSSFYIRAIRAF